MLSVSLVGRKIELESLFPFPEPFLLKFVSFLPHPLLLPMLSLVLSLYPLHERAIPTHGSHLHTERGEAGTPHPHQTLDLLEALEQRGSGGIREPAPTVTSQLSLRCGLAAGSPGAANGSAGRVAAQPMGARGVWRRRDGGGAVLAGRAARGEAETVSDEPRAGRGGRGTPGAASPLSDSTRWSRARGLPHPPS